MAQVQEGPNVQKLAFLKKESYAMPEDMNVQLELARVRVSELVHFITS
jgi:hypothetical protein